MSKPTAMMKFFNSKNSLNSQRSMMVSSPIGFMRTASSRNNAQDQRVTLKTLPMSDSMTKNASERKSVSALIVITVFLILTQSLSTR